LFGGKVMQPLVSAIINNYNYGQFISEAIDSVLKQTYSNIELIIVDDGSTDNSRDIIENYAKEFPNKITTVFKRNGGQASAFNCGFEISKGEIICFLDSDDFWFPDKIEKIVNEHQIADIVEHSMLINNHSCRWLPNKNNAQILMKERGRFIRFAETSALSFSKQLLNKIFPIPEKGLEICSETYLLYSSLYFTNKVCTLKEALSFYRVHGKNNWYENENADKNNFPKILDLVNKFLSSVQEDEILFGEKKINQVVNDLIIYQGKRYALYGTGSVSEKVFNKVIESGALVSLYIETVPPKETMEKNNIPIVPVECLNEKESCYDYLIISSSFQDEIMSQLKKYNIPKRKIIDLLI
jgi:glycosyltransferase involved in cell wall biosynthesis